MPRRTDALAPEKREKQSITPLSHSRQPRFRLVGRASASMTLRSAALGMSSSETTSAPSEEASDSLPEPSSEAEEAGSKSSSCLGLWWGVVEGKWGCILCRRFWGSV